MTQMHRDEQTDESIREQGHKLADAGFVEDFRRQSTFEGERCILPFDLLSRMRPPSDHNGDCSIML